MVTKNMAENKKEITIEQANAEEHKVIEDSNKLIWIILLVGYFSMLYFGGII